jgi:flagellar hook assembly protein FlgD
LNYPNPFRDMTTFSFEHNRSGEDLEVIIQIYSREGRLVKVVAGESVNSEFRINDIQWDGRGGSGKKLETGIYIYRVNVRSLVDGAKNEEFKKLVIIN